MTLAVAPTAQPRRRSGPRPFTLAHFRRWASDLILDDDTTWRLEPFQLAFIDDLFRGKPENWLIVPEGNGKTTLVAGIGLYHCEFRPFASIPIAASSVQQADWMYKQAETFVFRSPRLHAPMHSPIQAARGKLKTQVPRFSCRPGFRRIEHAEGGWMRIYASDDTTADGIIPTMAILDELHRHRDLRLYRTWKGKADKRGAQIVTISTAGEPDSEFERQREAIRQTATDIRRAGSFLRAEHESLILHEWAVPEGGDVEDMAVVKAANPFSRITPESLAKKFDSPTMTMQHWRRFSCNVPTRGNDAAIQEAEWKAAATTDEIPMGEPIWLGLDVGWKWDTTAAVPLWFRDQEYRLFGPARVLVPPRDMSTLDPMLVEQMLHEIHDRNPIHTVVMDTTRAEQLASWLESDLGATVIDRSQSSVWAAEDYERFMDALRNGWLKHSGDADLTSHVFNAVARILPGGKARFDRPALFRRSADQDRRVIDALTAAAMVHAVAAITVEPEPSVYEERGMVEIG